MTGAEQTGRPRVALAGFGTVGKGVYELLTAAPERFDVVGVLCRDPDPHIAAGAPAALFETDIRALPPFDRFVEAIGGVCPAGALVLAAIERGADVVTANKTLVARRFAELERAAHKARIRLAYSAAVGGGVPMLETIDACAREGAIRRIEAVLNGTTNFVLDRIGAGASVEDAVRQAQDAGFAEADPTADIDGVDAAEKLSLMVRRAFAAAVDPDAIPRAALATLSAEAVVEAAQAGAPFKQVAHAEMKAGVVETAVRLIQTPAGSPLAKPQREENCLVITMRSGVTRIVHGKGAGRAPTAASVFSDIEMLTGVREPAPA